MAAISATSTKTPDGGGFSAIKGQLQALGREALLILLDHPQDERTQTRLSDLPAMGVGAKTAVTDNQFNPRISMRLMTIR
jgi:hypothetical protein